MYPTKLNEHLIFQPSLKFGEGELPAQCKRPWNLTSSCLLLKKEVWSHRDPKSGLIRVVGLLLVFQNWSIYGMFEILNFEWGLYVIKFWFYKIWSPEKLQFCFWIMLQARCIIFLFKFSKICMEERAQKLILVLKITK